VAAFQATRIEQFLDDSDLIVAQEFLPTTFDWRIGILDERPLFACKYYMANDHWQIIRHDRAGEERYGKSETLPVELAPRQAVRMALEGKVKTIDGADVDISVQTICCHGDTPGAQHIVRAVREALDRAGCQVKPLRDWLPKA
jgi:hypothetical protein